MGIDQNKQKLDMLEKGKLVNLELNHEKIFKEISNIVKFKKLYKI